MKARELRDMICRGDNVRELDLEVRIVLNQPGMPATPTVGVATASLGFDWNHGHLLLMTDKPIVAKPKTKKQRRDEWKDEEMRLNRRISELLGLTTLASRLLLDLRKKATGMEDGEDQLIMQSKIDKHMELVKKILRTT